MAGAGIVQSGTMDALVLMREVVPPVLCEVAVADEPSHLEDGFGTIEAPAGAGDAHAVLDEVPAGALDDARGDRPPTSEGGRVVQVRPLGRSSGPFRRTIWSLSGGSS